MTLQFLGSFAWACVNATIRKLVQAGLLPATRLDARVVSVGNLQAGGAGKTPLVAQIAREAVARGISVCILTRGYKGLWEKQGGVIPPGTQAVNPDDCGDEPALLHDLVPEVWIGVGSNRRKQFEEVRFRAERNFDLVILDDGFQHWKIRKDLEVVALTSEKFGKRLFRDFPSAIGSGDLLVWTKGETSPSLAKGLSLVQLRYRLPKVADRPRIWLITGVADPNSVDWLARKSGLLPERVISLSDHVRYDKNQILSWMTEARAQQCEIAVTGKDWVKWKALGISPSEVQVLEPELEFVAGRDLWERRLWA